MGSLLGLLVLLTLVAWTEAVTTSTSTTTTGTTPALTCLSVADTDPYFECAATQTGLFGTYSDYCCSTDGTGTGCTAKTTGVSCGSKTPNCCKGSGSSLSCVFEADSIGHYTCDSSRSAFCCAEDPASPFWKASTCQPRAGCDRTANPNIVCCAGGGSSSSPSTSPASGKSPSPSPSPSSSSSPKPTPAGGSSGSLSCLSRADTDPYFVCSATQTGYSGTYSDYCCNGDGLSTGCTPKAYGIACQGTKYSNCCKGSGSSLSCLTSDQAFGRYTCDTGRSSYCCADDPASSFWLPSQCFPRAGCDLNAYPEIVCCTGSSGSSSPSTSPSTSPSPTSTVAPGTSTIDSSTCLSQSDSDNYFVCSASQAGLTGTASNYCCSRDGGGSCSAQTIGKACSSDRPFQNCCSGSGSSLKCLAQADVLGRYTCDVGYTSGCCADDPGAGSTTCYPKASCPSTFDYPYTDCCKKAPAVGTSPAISGTSSTCLSAADANNYFVCSAAQAGLSSTATNYCCSQDGAGTCSPQTIGTACPTARPFSNCCAGTGTAFSCLAVSVGLGRYTCDTSRSKYCCKGDPADGITDCFPYGLCPDKTIYDITTCCLGGAAPSPAPGTRAIVVPADTPAATPAKSPVAVAVPAAAPPSPLPTPVATVPKSVPSPAPAVPVTVNSPSPAPVAVPVAVPVVAPLSPPAAAPVATDAALLPPADAPVVDTPLVPSPTPLSGLIGANTTDSSANGPNTAPAAGPAVQVSDGPASAPATLAVLVDAVPSGGPVVAPVVIADGPAADTSSIPIKRSSIKIG